MKPIKQSLTVFLLGATGNLAQRKILKAVYKLFKQGLLPEQFALIAVGRSKLSTKEFVLMTAGAVKPDDILVWERFRDSLTYIAGDLTDKATFERIKKVHDRQGKCGNHLWYAATLPSLYVDVARYIGQVGLNRSRCGWTKLLIEKPFGTDFETAQELNGFLSTIFSEEQIYRIDHFLAKETVQNLLTFRFGNGIFEHLWRKEYIDNIQVQAAETTGVAGRGEFYEGVGTVRDVVQNHVIQLVATTLMEEPKTNSAADINRRRNELLKTLKLADKPENSARFGQYQEYLQDSGLPVTESRTETAVVAKMEVATERWRGVPIYIRAGKSLKQNVTEISIQFKEPQNALFKPLGIQKPNVLTLRIQPNEGVVLRLRGKRPGLKMAVDEIPMEFCYKNIFQMDLVEAYEKLMYDAIEGDTTLFPDTAGIEAAWQVIEPLLAYKRRPEFDLEVYQSGTWGPESFDQFISQDGREWLEPSQLFCSKI